MELPGRRELREQILHQMDGRTSYVSDADVYREIDKAILRSGHSGYGTLSEKEELRRQMFSSIRGFDVLEKYLEDSSISEIMVIGASHIFVEQNGRVRRTRDHFFEEADVYRLIEQIVAPTNRMVNEASPIVDSRLPDGSRVHIVLPPISLEGPVITIRKFLKGGMTIARLLAFGEFPEALTGILSALVKGKYNILISGATNSGKSSLLNALAEYIGQEERVITIEDSAELQLFHVDNLVRLETRNANVEGANEITMQDLIKASLRMRPDRIIVGEVRGAEAMSMLQALSTGRDAEIQSQVNLMASALTGVVGIPQTAKAVQMMLRAVLSYGESLLELHTLFEGGEISLTKDRGNWNLELKTMVKQLKEKKAVKKGKHNISYKDYLKVLLFMKGNSTILCYRMMDIMQENTACKEAGFLMENCLFSYKWEGSLSFGSIKMKFEKQVSY